MHRVNAAYNVRVTRFKAELNCSLGGTLRVGLARGLFV